MLMLRGLRALPSREAIVALSAGFALGLAFARLPAAPLSLRQRPRDLSPAEDPQHGPTENSEDAPPPAEGSLKKDGGGRLLCWVMTGPSNHESKARHVKATWGRRCDILLFMSTANDSSLPSVALPGVEEGRDALWAKTREAFRHVHRHYDGAYDWALKADDDTYVVVENLRYFLSRYNASEPLFFGCRLRRDVKQGLMHGGAGYVLSRQSVKMFVEQALPDEEICQVRNRGGEDVEIARCLEAVGVPAMDTRDSIGRERFFPRPPEFHLGPNFKSPILWYPHEEGLRCCSNLTISFHYIRPRTMYVLEFLLYYLRPVGVSRDEASLDALNRAPEPPKFEPKKP